jgi:PKD repeat protein
MTSDYDIFISHKNLGPDGVKTEDSIIADKLHIYLVNKGFNVFKSNISLAKLGVSDYKKAIDSALDHSKLLVLVGTSTENINSEWVRYEWDSFFNDILSGYKPDAKVFGYIKNVRMLDLPRALRNTQCIEAGPDGFEELYGFISKALGQRLATKFSADATSGKIPFTVTFRDESLGSPTHHMWDFGDGGKSTERNPVHIYEKPGLYSVKLTLSNQEENNSSERKDFISVSPRILPTAGFNVNANSGKAPFEGVFKSVSTGNPTQFSWDFGDGCTSDSQDPNHIYEKPGKYAVSLTVTNDDGSDKTTKPGYIQVIAPPKDPSKGQSLKIPLIIVSAILLIGVVIVGVWAINGSNLLQPNITANANLKIDPSLVPIFSVDRTSGPAPLSVSFTDTSEGAPDTWLWEFGDGSSSAKQNPVYTYQNPGDYSAQLLIAKNGSAKTPSRSQIISVAIPVKVVDTAAATPGGSSNPVDTIPSGKLDFTANKVINSLYTVYFEASNVPNGTYSYHWDFGDQKDSFSKTGVRTYAGSGEYLVTLRIETPSGPMMKVKKMKLSNEGALSFV